jgi:capsular exopolysaccharide synthesis family protein
MQALKNSVKQSQDDIILSDYIRLIVKNIHWVILFAVLSFGLAFLKLRYEDVIYEAKGSIKIDAENNNLLKEITILKDFGSPKDKVLTETHIIKSKLLISKALDRLPIQVSYFSSGRVVNKEVYTSTPFSVVLLLPDSVQFDKKYGITILNDETYEISWENEAGETKLIHAQFGDSIRFDQNHVKVIFNKTNYQQFSNKTNKFNFVFNSKNVLYSRVSGNLMVEQIDKGVSIVSITYKDVVPEFARDLVNALSQVYTEFDILYKSQTATQTIEFMDRLISDLNKTVQSSESGMADFKKGHNLLDIEQSSEKGLQDLTDLQVNLRMHQIQLLAIDNIENQIQESKGSASLPMSIDGKIDPMLLELLTALNKLNYERISLSEKVTSNSISMIELNRQIEETIKSIRQNIRFARKKIRSQIEFYEKQINAILGSLKQLPVAEQQYITLKRDLEVNQKVYGFLLQTKLEASISRASIVSSARIIDQAEIPKVSVEPNRKLTYIVYIIIGIMSAIGLILFLKMLNNKILSTEDVESSTSLPLLGTILNYPRILRGDESSLVIVNEQRTVFGESFRAVRTNLQFLLPEKKSKIITISSTISGEGKTFTSINLAGLLTMLNKKVILIGCDLRKPQLDNTFKGGGHHGLSSYLIGKSTLEECILKTELEHLFVIKSGPIPPNPSELLNSEKMHQLLKWLEGNYDYIILDTPPVGLVSDAILLMKMSDIVLYIIKSGYSQRDFLELPSRIIHEHNIGNLYLVLNSYKAERTKGKNGYGYYGFNSDTHGYYDEYQMLNKGVIQQIRDKLFK